ncbi:MAG: hypothetical protein D6681_16080 [Calditrichaeota bacterium]|nr:MAG: hypothetical protein D6681_16080 [Calditrichota bacterium]
MGGLESLVLCLLLLGWGNFLLSQEYPWLTAYDSTQALYRRIPAPPGFRRIKPPQDSFARWLQHLPLKPGHPPVYLYNGKMKPNQAVHAAVVDIDVGNRDLQQCADAVIRLRAEYLYSRKAFDALHFNFTSGDRVDFSRWINGERPRVTGNQVIWQHTRQPGSDYRNFRDYLTTIFTYAGTYSLRREMIPVKNVQDMKIGDVFIEGGFPGHAVMVVDMAVHPQTGEKVFLLAQSYMPAQDIHILKNPSDSSLSPWYPVDFGNILHTPEWTFRRSDLRRFTEPPLPSR